MNIIFNISAHPDTNPKDAIRDACCFSNHNYCVVRLELEGVTLEIIPGADRDVLQEKWEREKLIAAKQAEDREIAAIDALMKGGLGNPYE